MTREWISTTQAAAEIGMSDEWVRQQIKAGRLRATVVDGDARRLYRISRVDWQEYRSRRFIPSTEYDWDRGDGER